MGSPVVICFTGIDGAGKTTLAKGLTMWFRKRGLPCRYVYGKLVPFFSKPVIILARMFVGGVRRGPLEPTAKNQAISKHPMLAHAYELMLLADYALQMAVKVLLPLALFKRNLVCDRYVYDTFVSDLAVDFDYSPDRLDKALRRFFRFFPEPTMTFLVDVPDEVAFARKADIQSVRYLDIRREKYCALARSYGFRHLDGCQELSSLKNVIEGEVEALLAGQQLTAFGKELGAGVSRPCEYASRPRGSHTKNT